jgi:selenium-binding protein 1
MFQPNHQTASRFAALLLAAGILGLGTIRSFPRRTDKPRLSPQERSETNENGKDDQEEKYLFVWAGDQARINPDFLAVVNFDESSPNYGKVINTVPLPGPGASGNEPHHVGLSRDGRVLACGGLLSVLRGQNEIFFFDVSHPAAPTFLSAANPPQSAITDEFYPLPDGGFLVTMMGGAEGHHPGRVVEFNKQLQLVSENPAEPPMEGFNPHGISVRPELNLMVTSDFICPATTLDVVPGDMDLRGSVRVWDFKQRRIVRTINLTEAVGTIDVRLIPGDQRARAYTAGMIDGHLYLIDTQRGSARSVFDFNSIAAGGWPQLMRMTKDGKRLFISMNTAGKIVMFDTSNPAKPKVLTVLNLGASSGPHYLALTDDERRLVISDYFLNEDSFGKVHAEGDHLVHVARVTNKNLELDSRFQLNFNTAFVTGPARPHGLAFK